MKEEGLLLWPRRYIHESRVKSLGRRRGEADRCSWRRRQDNPRSQRRLKSEAPAGEAASLDIKVRLIQVVFKQCMGMLLSTYDCIPHAMWILQLVQGPRPLFYMQITTKEPCGLQRMPAAIQHSAENAVRRHGRAERRHVFQHLNAG